MDSQLLVSLTKKYGSPLYVYNAEKMESQYNRITAAFSSVKKFSAMLSFEVAESTGAVPLIYVSFASSFSQAAKNTIARLT